MSVFTIVASDSSSITTCDHSLNIIEEIFNLRDEIVENRRWFHAHPELSFQEVNTAARIVDHLRSYGITEIYERIGKTGVVAIIRGSSDGPCIALRADIDALPIQETAEILYKSTNDGVMHACGHDGHIASLLAAAKVLFKQRRNITGIVKLIFQPAEEGYAGALAMVKDGVLEGDSCGPRVDSIYGIHLWSPDPVGTIGCREGPIMAASDRFKITVKGKGGHGAMPQGTVDAIVEAASVVQALQTIVSRNMDPLESGVVTCGTINGGYGYNIVPDNVVITGTCRSFTPSMQELIKSRMCDVCCGVARTYGGDIKMDYEHGYPPTINAYPECVKVVTCAASKIVGEEWSAKPQKTMGAEDFSYFLQERPGCFFFVGAALPGEPRPHHKSVFDFDETALLVSASMFIQIIRDLLSSM